MNAALLLVTALMLSLPLTAASAEAQTAKTWRFEFESLSTTNGKMFVFAKGWPSNPIINLESESFWGWTAFADDPFGDDGDSYGVAAGVWPAYVVVKHSIDSPAPGELHKIMFAIVDGGYIKAWSQGVEVSLNIIFHIYIADLYSGLRHPNIVRWRMCPEFPDPLVDWSSELAAAPQWAHTRAVKNTDPNYVPPAVENIRHGVDGNGCLFVEVDMAPSSYTDPNTGRTTTYNSTWHHKYARIQYLEFEVSFSVKYGFPGQGTLEYAFVQGDSPIFNTPTPPDFSAPPSFSLPLTSDFDPLKVAWVAVFVIIGVLMLANQANAPIFAAIASLGLWAAKGAGLFNAPDLVVGLLLAASGVGLVVWRLKGA